LLLLLLLHLHGSVLSVTILSLIDPCTWPNITPVASGEFGKFTLNLDLAMQPATCGSLKGFAAGGKTPRHRQPNHDGVKCYQNS